MLKEALEDLLEGRDLSTERMESIVTHIMHDPVPEQVSALLVLLRVKRECSDELFGMLRALEKQMVPVHLDFPVLELVGTGGDGAHTLNISTGSAIVAASCGVKVAKHGNRAVSSKCGAADVLEALGLSMSSDPEYVAKTIEAVGIGFMFAPYFHPAFQNIATIRRNLKTRTVFNLVGPLLNPASAEYQLIGVYDHRLLKTFAETLVRKKVKRALVVHGYGLDELSCLGPSESLYVSEGQIQHLCIDPQDYGLSYCTLEDLRGGTARENAQRLSHIFSGGSDPASDTLALNAGAAMFLYGLVSNLGDGIDAAKSALKSGLPYQLLLKWREYVSRRNS